MAKTLGDITNELTQKILEPAKADAEQIIRNAESQAAKLMAEARAQADQIREAAKRDAENLKKQMDIDLETASRNFLMMVEERLEKAVVGPVIEEALKPLLSDRDFLEKMILEVLAGYTRHEGKEHTIEILLPEARKAELETWFMEKFRGRMSQPLDVRFTDKMAFGFKIGVAGEGSHVNFSEGLVEAFSQFCSPRFRKYFFARKES
jgi:V/A-type H+-transporting ATPase subunit E